MARPPFLLAALAAVVPAAAQDAAPPKELGAVRFGRDLDAALRARPQAPVFLLFQEIPG